jgi:hypothetical protein
VFNRYILAGLMMIAMLIGGCQMVNNVQPVNINNISVSSNSTSLDLNITRPVDESVVRSNPVTVSGNTSPAAEVMINGLSVPVEDGHFTAEVELEPGPNLIDISAKDSTSKETDRTLTIVYIP